MEQFPFSPKLMTNRWPAEHFISTMMLPLSPERARFPNKDEEVDLLALDKALNRLAELDERQAKIVELRYFSGLTIEETAEVLHISQATVKRDWNMAKAWLRSEIGDGGQAS